MAGEKQTNLEAAVLIPLAQSAVSGFLAGGGAWVAATVFDWRDPLVWGIGAYSAVSLLGWLFFRSEWREGVNHLLGMVRPAELQPDKVYPATVTRIQVVSADPGGAFVVAKNVETPLTPEIVAIVAKRVLKTGSFSHASLAGPGRPLTRSEYEQLRDEFIARGLAYWNCPTSHNRGVGLTRAGMAALDHYANTPPTSPSGPQLIKS